MPCIRAWLQPCRWRQSIQGFSPRCLPPCQVRETIGELLGPLDQSRLHRVRRYVFPMLDGRGLGWSWWWRRTYALNSVCCPEEHGEQVLPLPGAKAQFLSRFGMAEAMP